MTRISGPHPSTITRTTSLISIRRRTLPERGGRDTGVAPLALANPRASLRLTRQGGAELGLGLAVRQIRQRRSTATTYLHQPPKRHKLDSPKLRRKKNASRDSLVPSATFSLRPFKQMARFPD